MANRSVVQPAKKANRRPSTASNTEESTRISHANSAPAETSEPSLPVPDRQRARLDAGERKAAREKRRFEALACEVEADAEVMAAVCHRLSLLVGNASRESWRGFTGDARELLGELRVYAGLVQGTLDAIEAVV
jgi:hypothetical protein